MSEFRKLQAKLQKIEEGFYSRLAAEIEEMRRANPKLSSVELVQLARKLHGEEAADWLDARLEDEAERAENIRRNIIGDDAMTNLLGEEDSKTKFHSKLKGEDFAPGDKVCYTPEAGRAAGERGEGCGTVVGTLQNEYGEPSVAVEWDDDEYSATARLIHPIHLMKTSKEEEDFWDWTGKYNTLDEEEIHMPDLGRYWVYINRPDLDYVMYHIPRSQAEEGEPRFLKVDKATGNWQTQNWKANNEPAVQQGKGTEPHIIEEDHHPEDSINQQIKSLLAQGKKVMSRVPGAIGTVEEIDERGISIVQHPSESKRGRSAVNFETFSNIEIIGQLFNYDIVQHWDDNEIDEATVEVPAELRGATKMTGKATSDDASEFMSDLGIDDEVSDDVVDPETGELLFQPGQTKRAEMKKGAHVILNRDDFTRGAKLAQPILHADSWRGDFEDKHEAAWELLDELRNGDFYNVIWRDTADMVDNPEEMMSKDYDVYVEVPVVLKRKDGLQLDSDDHDNIKEIIKAVRNASTMQNVGIMYMGSTDGGTTARFTPTFF